MKTPSAKSFAVGTNHLLDSRYCYTPGFGRLILRELLPDNHNLQRVVSDSGLLSALVDDNKATCILKGFSL